MQAPRMELAGVPQMPSMGPHLALEAGYGSGAFPALIPPTTPSILASAPVAASPPMAQGPVPSSSELALGWIAPAASLPKIVTSVPPLVRSVPPLVTSVPPLVMSVTPLVMSVPPLVPSPSSGEAPALGTAFGDSAGPSPIAGPSASQPLQATEDVEPEHGPADAAAAAPQDAAGEDPRPETVLPVAQGRGDPGFGLLNFVETVGERRRSKEAGQQPPSANGPDQALGAAGPSAVEIDQDAFAAAAALLLGPQGDPPGLVSAHSAPSPDPQVQAVPKSVSMRSFTRLPSAAAGPVAEPKKQTMGGLWTEVANAPIGAPAGRSAPSYRDVTASVKAEGGPAETEGGLGEGEFSEKLTAVGNQWWAGKRIMQPAQVDEGQSAGAIPTGSYLSGKDLKSLNDTQLYKVFEQGVADVPSAQPGEVGELALPLLPRSLVGQLFADNELRCKVCHSIVLPKRLGLVS